MFFWNFQETIFHHANHNKKHKIEHNNKCPGCDKVNNYYFQLLKTLSIDGNETWNMRFLTLKSSIKGEAHNMDKYFETSKWKHTYKYRTAKTKQHKLQPKKLPNRKYLINYVSVNSVTKCFNPMVNFPSLTTSHK